MHGSLAGGEHNSPKSAPTCQQPANGNKQPRGTIVIECGRLFRLGLAMQVVSALFHSFHAQDLV